MNKKSLLYKSIHKFADELYEYIIKNNIAKDDYEFGAWDYFWLNALIGAWLTKYVNTDRPAIGHLWIRKNDDVNNEKHLARATKRENEYLLKLINDLRDMDAMDNKQYNGIYHRLKKIHRTLWW